jgi:hypothetical protein
MDAKEARNAPFLAPHLNPPHVVPMSNTGITEAIGAVANNHGGATTDQKKTR